ncbi:MAG: hypothetical protein AAB641_00670 [Patescibacteria group bacterium]
MKLALLFLVLTKLSFIAGFTVRWKTFRVIIMLVDGGFAWWGMAQGFLALTRGASLQSVFIGMFLYSLPMSSLYAGRFVRVGLEFARERTKRARSLEYELG